VKRGIMGYSPSVTRLIEELAKLPGIGSKTAERLAFHILRSPDADVAGLVSSLEEVKRSVRPCSRCYSPGESDPCHICGDPARDGGVVCVVEESKDLLSIEKVGTYRGVYHVLSGALSPMQGVEPDDLTIPDLLRRVQGGAVREVILATNPTTEGDCTALYLAERLRPLGVKVTRLARGIPTGSPIEFASKAILGDALQGRVEFDGDAQGAEAARS
jgi:recombination protein RecR